jgi:hypothetical protein
MPYIKVQVLQHVYDNSTKIWKLDSINLQLFFNRNELSFWRYDKNNEKAVNVYSSLL